MRSHSASALAVAQRILRDETRDRRVNLADAALAIDAAEDFARYPRSRWATPTGEWEELVTALAMTLIRLEGAFSCMGRAEAVRTLRAAVALPLPALPGPSYAAAEGS